MMIPLTMMSAMASLLVDTDSINTVNPFWGTEAGGHVFPGATRPFGMVKMGIDVEGASFGDAYSGYAPDGRVVAISMMHESGTGGAPQYGVASQLPYLGAIDYSTGASYNTRSVEDVASPGYYKTVFNNGISVELGAANRSGLYHYEFPQNSVPQIIVEGSAHLKAPERARWTQYFVNGSVHTREDWSHYSGQTTIKGGWGGQTAWTLYYCGEFNSPPTEVTSFAGHTSIKNSTRASSITQDDSMGLVFSFAENTTDLLSKVGISFISETQACSNIVKDFGNDYNFQKLLRDSVNIWNTEVFNKVSVGTDNDTISELIYSSLYGAHLLPSNRTGENPSWQSSEPYYDDWFTIWDTFRCLNPLYNVLSPSRGAELVRSLIDIYRHDGFMPDGRAANQNGRSQGGSNADIVLADAYVKGITEGINWEAGYAAMKKDAEVVPPYVYDSFATDASNQEGRGALSDWLKYGYITRNFTRSVTRTVEYAYNDFALSVVAKGLNKTADAGTYLRRSANWQNIWNFNATSPGYDYKGFVQPKNANGEFNYENYSPMDCGHCYWPDDEYEGLPVEYGWAVPHDVETLKKFIGSNATFIKRLDDMFGLKGAALADIGNEPSFLTPFLYNFVNEQYRTVELIRYLVNTKYNTGPAGLPGNSDAGAMQAWLFWSMVGLYPVAGTTTYLIASPFAQYLSFNLDNGKKLEITANSPTMTQFYVQSVTVNGKPWTKNWITHDEIFKNGGTIHFELGETAVVWETGEFPPSPGHYSLI